jgi:hypothetical protein
MEGYPFEVDVTELSDDMRDQLLRSGTLCHLAYTAFKGDAEAKSNLTKILIRMDSGNLERFYYAIHVLHEGLLAAIDVNNQRVNDQQSKLN